MLIAIDFDNTYTQDPTFWKLMFVNAVARGHQIICVTGRTEAQPVEIRVPVVYAGNEYKRKAAERAGYKVDVWIDDMPEMIAPTKILDFGG